MWIVVVGGFSARGERRGIFFSETRLRGWNGGSAVLRRPVKEGVRGIRSGGGRRCVRRRACLIGKSAYECAEGNCSERFRV